MKKRQLRFDGAAPLPIVIYLISIAVSLMYTICRRQFLPCAVIMSALTAGIFFLFYKMRFHPKATALLVLGFVTAAWTAGTAAASWNPGGDVSFMDFLFSASAQFVIPYAAAAIFIFSLVIGFIGFYFSVMSLRPCFLMLLTFIPLILSARTSRELPAYFMAIMAGAFVWAAANSSQYVPNTMTDPAWKTVSASAKIPEALIGAVPEVFEDKRGRRRRIAISCAAAVLAGLLALILPKNTDTPLKDQLDHMAPQQGGYNYNNALTNFANHSSVNTGNNQTSGNVLFIVKSDRPAYLKRWAFDSYDPDGWTVIKDFDMGYAGWEYNAAISDIPSLMYDISEARDSLPEDMQALIGGEPCVKGGRLDMTIIITSSSSTRVVIHPDRMYGIILPDECGRTFRLAREDYFTEAAIPQYSSYYVYYSPAVVNDGVVQRLDYDSYAQLLDSALDNGVISNARYSALKSELDEVLDYRNATIDDGVTPELEALAQKITAGLTSDYDKAQAIERWFGEAGFIYDLSFAPERTGVDYFINESRRGICSDYASALTLLARAAGLTARYCEGFAMPQECYNESLGVYEITGDQAHAWTQIYIPGAGWLDFDGTRYAGEAADDEVPMIWLYIAAGAAVLLILGVIFHKKLGWLWFCMTYSMRSGDGRVRGVYIRARSLAAAVSGREAESMSCGEVRNIISGSLSMPEQAERICAAADELFYSPDKRTERDTKPLLRDLKAVRKRRRELKK